MQDPQTATVQFLLPVAAAYGSACALWLAYDWRFNLRGSEPPLEPSDHPYWDLLLTILAGAGIFLLGAAYRAGWLLPSGPDAVGRIGWLADNLIIFSPIALVLALRRQGLHTVFLSAARWPEKLALGIAAGIVAVTVYCGSRGELRQVPEHLVAALTVDKLVNFLPVFLEGVAVVFAFVRLRWLTNTAVAVFIPSLLFAAAHVPGSIEQGRGLPHILAFFAFNTALPAVVFGVVARSRDVIWLGMAHYLMDIAIRAF